MIKYGRIIFEVLPDETTHTLIALCTDWTVGKKVSQAPAPGTISGPPGEREERERGEGEREERGRGDIEGKRGRNDKWGRERGEEGERVEEGERG